MLAVIVTCVVFLAVGQIRPEPQVARARTVRARQCRFGRWPFDLMP
jgi:hypothetical protein